MAPWGFSDARLKKPGLGRSQFWPSTLALQRHEPSRGSQIGGESNEPTALHEQALQPTMLSS
jgi:hypothetical protein